MKKRDLQNYIGKNLAELEKDVRSFREKLNSLRFNLAAGKVKNIKEIHDLKKSIAQLLTVIQSKKT